MIGSHGDEEPERVDRELVDRKPDAPDADVAELIALIQRLDADNERLRMKTLELGEMVEDAVTAEVAGERRISALEGQVTALEAELAALTNTRVFRATRGLRTTYGRLRSRLGGSR